MIGTFQDGVSDAGQQAAVSGEGVLGWFEATVLGLIEGLTEFLPVSSTGHLIVAQRMLGLPEGNASNTFAVGIQIGAITAILVIYWRRLFDAARTFAKPSDGKPNLLGQIMIAAIPAVVAGLLLEKWIDANLFSVNIVAYALVVGGVLLLILERFLKNRPNTIEDRTIEDLSAMSYRSAFYVGLWQCLALVPGTSRSGATIGGALVLGLSRTAAAEFSFLVGLPILYGASLYKLISMRDELSSEMIMPFAVGTVVSFIAAIVVVKPFIAFLRRHNFVPFAWYRIVVGIALIALIASGHLGSTN